MNSSPSEKTLITKKADDFLIGIYSGFQFVLRFFREVFKPPYEFKEIIKQCYQVGYKSLGLITLTGFITGLVFTKQSRPSLSEFGASSWLAFFSCDCYHKSTGSPGYGFNLLWESGLTNRCGTGFDEGDRTD